MYTCTLAKQNNERIVRQYKCTHWNSPKLDGYLVITTERVIFQGVTKTNTSTQKPTDRIVEEAEVKSVSGLSSFYGTKFNLVWLLIGIVMMLGSLGGIAAGISTIEKAGPYMPEGVIVLAAVGIVLGIAAFIGGILFIALLAFQKAFFLNIYSSQSAGTPISIGNTSQANHVLLALCGKPTTETDQMMTDLGAMIIDLKTDKEQAYEAWKA